MPEDERIKEVREYCTAVLSNYGEGDYYLGRDSVAQEVLDIIGKTAS